MVRRDFGSFPKACQKYFGPLVKPFGFVAVGGPVFRRNFGAVTHEIFLQLTRYGDGKFSCNVGVVVPSLGRLWGDSDSDSHVIGGRLSEAGLFDRDCWLPGDDKFQICQSFETFASYLPLAEHWLSQRITVGAVASDYAKVWGFDDPESQDLKVNQQLMVANYGYLLRLAGDIDASHRWLSAAKRLMLKPEYGMVRKKMVELKKAPEELAWLASVERALQCTGPD